MMEHRIRPIGRLPGLLRQDIGCFRSFLALVPAAYYILLLASIALADPELPRSAFYYNEMAFIPLVVLLTVLLFQKEFGGSLMEIVSTYPVSFTWLLARKLASVIFAAAALHAGWFWVYLIKFHAVPATVFLYNGNETYRTEHAAWYQLWGQALPEYLWIAVWTIIAMIGIRNLYGGLAAGFAIWLLEAMSNAGITYGFALYTIHIPQVDGFVMNRAVLLGSAIVMFAAAAWWMNRRARWIVRDDSDT